MTLQSDELIAKTNTFAEPICKSKLIMFYALGKF